MTTPPGPPSGVGPESADQSSNEVGFNDVGTNNVGSNDETTVMPSYGGQQSQPTHYGQQSHPNPYGQPQPGYPQPAYGSASVPGAGYPSPHAYGAPYPVQPTPSSATGIIAAILAFLGVLHVAIGVFSSLYTMFDDTGRGPGWFVVLMLVLALINFAIGVCLGVGGALLVQGKKLGQRLVVIGSGTVIAIQLLSMLFVLIAASSMASPDAAAVTIGGGLVTMVLLIFPVATIVLALLPTTRDWIQAKSAGGVGAAPAGPQQYGADQYGAQQYGAPQPYNPPQSYNPPPGPYGH